MFGVNHDTIYSPSLSICLEELIYRQAGERGCPGVASFLTHDDASENDLFDIRSILGNMVTSTLMKCYQNCLLVHTSEVAKVVMAFGK